MPVSAITSSTNGHSPGHNTSPQEAMRPQHHAQRRKHALDRYLAGDNRDHLCHQMAGSKSWRYTWKARDHPGDPSGATEEIQTSHQPCPHNTLDHRTGRHRDAANARPKRPQLWRPSHPTGPRTPRDRVCALAPHHLADSSASPKGGQIHHPLSAGRRGSEDVSTPRCRTVPPVLLLTPDVITCNRGGAM